MEIVPGIHLLRYPLDDLWTGIFVLARKKVVVIDTAFEPAIENLLYPYLLKLGRRPADIDLVINTHVHGDHIGGNARLRADAPIRLCAHRLGQAKLRDPFHHLNLIRRRFVPLVPFQEITSGLVPMDIDLALEDGQTIDLGDSELRVIHAPGHSSESICLHDSASGVLFTGDALQGRGTMSTGIAYYPDLAGYCATLRRVGALLEQGGVTQLAPSHPFAPIAGVIPAEEGVRFVACCRDTVELYRTLLRDYLADCTGTPDLRAAVRCLLEQAGLTTRPSVPALAYHTAAAHLAELLPGWRWPGAPE
jgi:glyoxylase-like metal-dependent hydrolase (beta-lactamase superfamily II)